jgi:hypothetical protein
MLVNPSKVMIPVWIFLSVALVWAYVELRSAYLEHKTPKKRTLTQREGVEILRELYPNHDGYMVGEGLNGEIIAGIFLEDGNVRDEGSDVAEAILNLIDRMAEKETNDE